MEIHAEQRCNRDCIKMPIHNPQANKLIVKIYIPTDLVIFNYMSHFMLYETKSTQTKLYSTGKASDCAQNIVIGSDKTTMLTMDHIFL